MATIALNTSRRLKIEKVLGKDATRPILTHFHLAVKKVGRGKAARKIGTIEATDSYKAVRLPVDLDVSDSDEFTEGMFTPEALKALEAQDSFTIYKDGVTANGTSYARVEVGTYPKLGNFMPEKDGMAEFVVGFNARFLADLAEAMGEEVVALRFTKHPTSGLPDPDKAIFVVPMNAKLGQTVFNETGPIGLLMPVKISGDAPVVKSV